MFRISRFLSRALLLGLAALWCAAAAPARAVTFDGANWSYDQGDFAGAKAGYEALIKEGNLRANIFYNLGNADFRLGDKKGAFLAYERALALEPGLPEALANLRLLRQETGAKLPARPWYDGAFSWPSPNAAAWLAAVGFWGLFLSLAPRFWKREAALIPAVFCALALAWGGGIAAWHGTRGDLWIVTADSASARTAPADNSPLQLALPMGSHLRLLEERGTWAHVRLPDNTTGWIAREGAEPVRL